MTSAAWVCDSCETNNLATATVCRVCDSPAGSASGQVSMVTQQAAPTVQHEQPPEFVESKHKRPVPQTPPTITMTSTTPRRTRPPAPPRRPAPPPRPAPRPGSSRAGRRVAWGLAVLLGVLVVIAYGPSLARFLSAAGASASAGTTTPRSTAPPCPSAVAMYLRDGGQNSTLVVSYTSDQFDVTLCQDDDGDLYYDGQAKDQPVSDRTHISIPATRTASGYQAYNKRYTYEIDPTEETLRYQGSEISRFALTRTGP
jgi:hypothetical protein